MKNVQVIDGAENCSYDIFSVSKEHYELLFPSGTDVEFIADFISRVGENVANEVTTAMWQNRQDKKEVNGIHGTLFYELDFKKRFYPTKRESEMIVALY